MSNRPQAKYKVTFAKFFGLWTTTKFFYKLADAEKFVSSLLGEWKIMKTNNDVVKTSLSLAHNQN